MKLSEFRVLIDKIHQKAIVKNNPIAFEMTAAEFFAYDAIKTFKEDIECRKHNLECDLDNLGHPENDGYYELEFGIELLGDIIELFDAYLSADDDVMECIETPDKIDLTIELKEE